MVADRAAHSIGDAAENALRFYWRPRGASAIAVARFFKNRSAR
jgi:hypothetical protein